MRRKGMVLICVLVSVCFLVSCGMGTEEKKDKEPVYVSGEQVEREESREPETGEAQSGTEPGASQSESESEAVETDRDLNGTETETGRSESESEASESDQDLNGTETKTSQSESESKAAESDQKLSGTEAETSEEQSMNAADKTASGTAAGDESNVGTPSESQTSTETEQQVSEPEGENGYLVVIDAGHQGKGNYEKEPVGPGATEMKARFHREPRGQPRGLQNMN